MKKMKHGGPTSHPLPRDKSRDEYAKIYQEEQQSARRDFMRTELIGGEFYGGVDPRRRQELGDGGMVRESKEGMANLPRQAIHCEYPTVGFYQSPYIDDGVLD